jgi:hypothetical protein
LNRRFIRLEYIDLWSRSPRSESVRECSSSMRQTLNTRDQDVKRIAEIEDTLSVADIVLYRSLSERKSGAAVSPNSSPSRSSWIWNWMWGSPVRISYVSPLPLTIGHQEAPALSGLTAEQKVELYNAIEYSPEQEDTATAEAQNVRLQFSNPLANGCCQYRSSPRRSSLACPSVLGLGASS